jgi:hypothetical protein
MKMKYVPRMVGKRARKELLGDHNSRKGRYLIYI